MHDYDQCPRSYSNTYVRINVAAALIPMLTVIIVTARINTKFIHQ